MNFWSFVGLSFSSHSRIVHSLKDVTVAGDRQQILNYAQNLWPLSSEDSLACHTYYDTGYPFIILISRSSDTQPNAERLAMELSLPVLTT